MPWHLVVKLRASCRSCRLCQIKYNAAHQLTSSCCYNLLNAAVSACMQFNAGSALAAGTLTALAFINTLCAAAAAMLTWVLVDNLRGHKLRATGVCVGAVVGLIAITPAAGTWRDSTV